MVSSPPSVFTFLDYHLFLEAWWRHAKEEQGRELTYQSFGDDVGCTRAAVHNVFSGRRLLSEGLAFSFADAMRLGEEETEFFVELVSFKNAAEHARASTDRDRRWEAQQQVRRSWKVICSRRGYREARQIDALAADYLSRWYYPAIRELSLLPDFRSDPAWIARALDPRIRVEQAEEALELLTRLGLLEPAPGGGLRATSAALRTPDEVAVHAVRPMYDQVFKELSPRAIDAFPPEDRELGLGIIAPPPELIPEIRRRMIAFGAEITRLCDQHLAGGIPAEQGAPPMQVEERSPARRIFLLGLQLFPLSQVPGAGASAAREEG